MKTDNMNKCIFILSDFNVVLDHPCKNKNDIIDAINKELKRDVKDGDWKEYPDFFGEISPDLIKKIVSLTYHSGYTNLIGKASGDVNVKLECILKEKI